MTFFLLVALAVTNILLSHGVVFSMKQMEDLALDLTPLFNLSPDSRTVV